MSAGRVLLEELAPELVRALANCDHQVTEDVYAATGVRVFHCPRCGATRTPSMTPGEWYPSEIGRLAKTLLEKAGNP